MIENPERLFHVVVPGLFTVSAVLNVYPHEAANPQVRRTLAAMACAAKFTQLLSRPTDHRKAATFFLTGLARLQLITTLHSSQK